MGGLAVGLDVGSLLAALDRAHYAVVTTDPEGVVRSFGGAAPRLLGYDATEIVDRENVLVFHDRQEVELRAAQLSREEGRVVTCHDALVAGARDGEIGERTWTFVTKGGSRISILVTVCPIHDTSGALTGFVHLGHDTSRANRTERLRNEFISTVSHELRTPLASIRGSLGLLEGRVMGDLPGPAMELVKMARHASDRLIRLINDLLDLEKIEAGKYRFHQEEEDAEALVTETIGQMRQIAMKAGVRLVSNLDAQGAVYVDHDRIVQVLTNLIANAIRFSPRGGTVLVTVSPGRNGFCRFAVRDRGTGIPQESLSRLFNKFETLDSSDSREHGGTGLGLAISKAIIAQHQGEVGVESTVGVGSTFWFEVPLLRRALGTVPPPGTPLLMLVARDEHLSRDLGTRISGEGWRLVRASGADGADRLIREEPPSTILVDADTVPHGLEFLGSLSHRRDVRTANLVALSARARPELASRTRAAWIQKPVDGAALVAHLRTIARPAVPSVLLVEDDASTRMVLAAQLRACGIPCLEAATGSEAFRIAHASRPGLIMLEVGGAQRDGQQLVLALKAGPLRAVPLIVHSGRELTPAERAALTLGPTRHFTNGLPTEAELIGAVRDLLTLGERTT